MPLFIVDGYNLLFRIYHIDRALQSARRHLLENLVKQAQALALDISIVFDAAYQEEEMARGHFGRLEIIFTDSGESADDYILKMASQVLPHQAIVVTSDKALAKKVRWQRVPVISVERFSAELTSRYHNAPSSKPPRPEKGLLRKMERNAAKTFSEDAQPQPPLETPLKNPLPREAKEVERYLSLFQGSKPQQKKAAPFEPDIKRWQRLFENPKEDEDRLF
ncbi:MAG: hypothetical protein K0S07_1008 [Chlamydiales bacterium]|jgi:predicted RNA-binding protein with PIN domain|nr:hypothetical protein [Chlamydiales bacterium]